MSKFIRKEILEDKMMLSIVRYKMATRGVLLDVWRLAKASVAMLSRLVGGGDNFSNAILKKKVTL